MWALTSGTAKTWTSLEIVDGKLPVQPQFAKLLPRHSETPTAGSNTATTETREAKRTNWIPRIVRLSSSMEATNRKQNVMHRKLGGLQIERPPPNSLTLVPGGATADAATSGLPAAMAASFSR